MKKYLFYLALFTSSVGSASQELAALTRCHEALNDKSAGRSEKLNTDQATPILISSGKNIYFFTEKSIYVLENKFADKEIVVKIDEAGNSFFRKINIKKNGSLGSISFQDLTSLEKQNALIARAQLDSNSLEILKKDLITRMKSVSGEYQNKYAPQETIEALNQCVSVKSPELQKSLDQQVTYYKSITRKNNRYNKPKNPGVN